ncbi:hypothetical protein J2Z49_000248 [Desulfofundulus luciae]|uniref:Uncharacterized protein n=1 Tax=Desulfofundulus luciae TaxID=74702 RepID=A0ABU0B124_9FIRM|nr:hypothetical protein [Desulfofundulus luciae]MDQ0285158.1 hypothetical protein [Desulfofundulus luciae]
MAEKGDNQPARQKRKISPEEKQQRYKLRLRDLLYPDNLVKRYLGLGNPGIQVLVDCPQGEPPEDLSVLGRI